MSAPDYATEIAALEKGMSTGEVTIESDGDRVTYRSITDIKAALDYFRGRAAAAAGTLTRGGSTVARFDRDCG